MTEIYSFWQATTIIPDTHIAKGDTSGVCKGSGDTHISSSGILPALSIRPGVEELRGKAAAGQE